jgi:Ca2+-binding RTX toxin-like protein
MSVISLRKEAMNTRIRTYRSRHARLATAAIVLATAVAAATWLAGHSYAARPKLPTAQLRYGLLTVEGTQGADRIALRLKAGDPGTLQVDAGDDGSADFSFPRTSVARILVRARAGDDAVRIDDANGSFTDTISTTIAGGRGNDTLTGGKGNEVLFGGSGNDLVDGKAGNDAALLGHGDDTFVWDPGDGSDSIEGQAGFDTMRFDGAAAAEHVDLSANGNRLRFFRDVATITMDTHGVERVDFNALGGADVVTVGDLRRTDVSAVNVDLAGALGGAAGDGAADRVVVNGTNRNDAIDVSGDAGEVKTSGLAATVSILHPEVANDRLELNTLAGHDTVDSVGLAAGAIQLFVNGLPVS